MAAAFPGRAARRYRQVLSSEAVRPPRRGGGLSPRVLFGGMLQELADGRGETRRRNCREGAPPIATPTLWYAHWRPPAQQRRRLPVLGCGTLLRLSQRLLRDQLPVASVDQRAGVVLAGDAEVLHVIRHRLSHLACDVVEEEDLQRS